MDDNYELDILMYKYKYINKNVIYKYIKYCSKKNGKIKYNKINYKNGEISMSSIWLNIVKINMKNYINILKVIYKNG